MRIISWNTNGLRATYKQGHFDPLFAQCDPDMLCLQETKATPEQLPEAVREVFGYDAYFSWPEVKKGYSGVAIYTKEIPLKVTMGIGLRASPAAARPQGDAEEGRTITAEYKNFYLITCYFPNGGGGPERLEYKLHFYEQFLKYIEDLRNPSKTSGRIGKPVIFCGDVNTAHTEIDLARPKENVMNTGFLPIERAWMDKLVEKGWIDVFRTLHPTTKDVYTYWDQKTASRERNVGWRIDYFFVSSDIKDTITNFQTLKDYYGSDHCPIVLDIQI
jgi:exodeoxyribonuclease-3